MRKGERVMKEEKPLILRAEVNAKVLIGTVFLCSFIFLGYVIELIRGSVSRFYGYGSMVAVAVILIGLLFIYRHNTACRKFKYIAIFSFFTLYFFVIFNSASPVSYTLIFPLVILFILYYDLRLMGIICALGVGSMIVKIIYFMFFVDASPMENFTLYMTQAMSVVLFFVMLWQCTKLSIKFNTVRMSEVEEEKNKTLGMADELQNTLEQLATNSNEILDSINAFSGNVAEISASIENIDEEMEKTLSTINEQVHITEQSNQYITVTEQSSQKVMEKVDDSEEKVKAGQEALNDLTGNMEKVATMNQLTYDTLKSLEHQVKEIDRDIKSIDDISEKTRLLALNASIESARVGEYGRGFAVIADEIKDLAEKTQQLTTQITDGVNNLRNETNDSVENFGALNQQLTQQKDLLHTNDLTFRSIASTTVEVSQSTEEANTSIHKITNNLNAIKDQSNQIANFAGTVKQSIDVTKQSFNHSLVQLERIQDYAVALSKLANAGK